MFSGINTNICKIVALFFADDGMILMHTLQEAKESIQILSNIAKDCGLIINKNKRNIIIFNSKNQPEYIDVYCYREQRQQKEQKSTQA